MRCVAPHSASRCVTHAAPSGRFDGLVRFDKMKSMSHQTNTLPSSLSSDPDLILEINGYRVTINHRKTRIRTDKKQGVYVNGRFTGEYEDKSMSIPMTQIKVSLQHYAGDVITYTMTQMGSKTSYTRSTTLPASKVINKTAFGDDMVEVKRKPESIDLMKAVAGISRMTGKEPTEVRRFFNITLLEAGVVR